MIPGDTWGADDRSVRPMSRRTLRAGWITHTIRSVDAGASPSVRDADPGLVAVHPAAARLAPSAVDNLLERVRREVAASAYDGRAYCLDVVGASRPSDQPTSHAVVKGGRTTCSSSYRRPRLLLLLCSCSWLAKHDSRSIRGFPARSRSLERRVSSASPSSTLLTHTGGVSSAFSQLPGFRKRTKVRGESVDDLAWLDATAQAELIRAGELTATEVVDAALERVEALNPTLNAVIHERSERARAEATQPIDGPFAGVPLLLKDAVAHSAGDPYHFGMRALKEEGWVEPRDTWLVERFRRAGFTIVGRTNTPELASSVTTEPLAYGPTRNPYDLTRSTGGSSGGSAAAVAAGMVPVAHGNDMGGSIRIPAAMCGLVGLSDDGAVCAHGCIP